MIAQAVLYERYMDIAHLESAGRLHIAQLENSDMICILTSWMSSRRSQKIEALTVAQEEVRELSAQVDSLHEIFGQEMEGLFRVKFLEAVGHNWNTMVPTG